MSSGAKQVLYIGQEATRNTAATSYYNLAFTDNSLDATVEKGQSTAITESRMSNGTFITGVSYAGDVNTEAQKSEIVDMLISGAAFNDWGADEVSFGGEVRKTFTAVLGYKDIANYHQFTGLHVNTMNVNIPIDGVCTIGFGFMGMGRTKINAAPASITPMPTDSEIISSVGVGNIKINDVVQTGVACVTAFSMSVNNSAQIQKCLGEGTSVGAIIETSVEVTGSITTAWAVASAELYEEQFKNEKISIEVPFYDESGNGYEITIPMAEFTMPLAKGAKGDILNTTFNYTAVKLPVKIKRVTAPEEPVGG